MTGYHHVKVHVKRVMIVFSNFSWVGYEALYDDDGAAGCRKTAVNILQDGVAFLVLPVVEDVLEEDDLRLGDGRPVEHVPGVELDLAGLTAAGCHHLHHVRLVQNRAAEVGRG